MIYRHLALVAAAALLTSCSGGGGAAVPQGTDNPDIAASAPIPGVSLPAGELVDQVLKPDEVPAGMVPIVKGSGPRDAKVVASYSGTGAAAASAEARLKAHQFVSAYVAQYANLSTGQVLSMVVSRFGSAPAAAADFADDLKGNQGKTVASPTLGEQSAVTVQSVPGTPASELVLVRFRRGTMTWSLAYKARTPADAQLPIQLAQKVLGRTAV
jgi:hypothetical protein